MQIARRTISGSLAMCLLVHACIPCCVAHQAICCGAQNGVRSHLVAAESGCDCCAQGRCVSESTTTANTPGEIVAAPVAPRTPVCPFCHSAQWRLSATVNAMKQQPNPATVMPALTWLEFESTAAIDSLRSPHVRCGLHALAFLGRWQV